ncbi:hypothetical protein RJT34_24464 [Clitoria ternatea]|uniref:Uncharacterized protein n=1 Tax=Clitoria ternatea TaxID=43366 RepID=A0AAN9IHI8_CLITE
MDFSAHLTAPKKHYDYQNKCRKASLAHFYKFQSSSFLMQETSRHSINKNQDVSLVRVKFEKKTKKQERLGLSKKFNELTAVECLF